MLNPAGGGAPTRKVMEVLVAVKPSATVSLMVPVAFLRGAGKKRRRRDT